MKKNNFLIKTSICLSLFSFIHIGARADKLDCKVTFVKKGEQSSETSEFRFTLNDAKKAAIEYFRTFPEIKEGTKIRFEKSNSEELTSASLKQQMSWIGPNNRNYAIYGKMVAELNQDPSLQIFRVFLGTGSGEVKTQDVFFVRLKVVNGIKLAEVSEDI